MYNFEDADDYRAEEFTDEFIADDVILADYIERAKDMQAELNSYEFNY